MNNYYLLKPFIRNTYLKEDYKVLIKHYFYSKLKESSLPPYATFVRADVFSDKIGNDFSVPRVENYVSFRDENEIQNILEKVILSVKREDISTQAKVIVNFIVKIGEKYCLTDENLNLISDYFEVIEPLFLKGTNFNTAEERFFEQYCGKEFPIDSANFNYSYPVLKKTNYMSQAYIVKKDACYGIINCNSEYIVPAKYEKIEPFSVKKDYIYDVEASFSIIELADAQIALYICKRNNEYKYDVYDTNGNVIFEQIDEISPCDEIASYSPSNEDSQTHITQIKVQSIYVKVSNVTETALADTIDNEEYKGYLTADKNFKYNVDALQSKLNNTESKIEPKQKSIANFNDKFNFYIDGSYYFEVLNAPKKLLDIFVMMSETISRIENIPQKMWLEFHSVSVLELFSLLNKKNICEILSMNITDLNLMVRTFLCLTRAGIISIDKILKLTEDELLKIKNLGKSGYREITTIRNVIRWVIDNSSAEYNINKNHRENPL